MRAVAVVVLVLALLLEAGCFFGSVITRNVAQLGEAPRPVPNRIEHPARPDARLAVLWIGQATALIQLDDRFVLTDPVFTSAVGQLSHRLVEPGLDPANLPPRLDAVLISHMHFDHLSVGSLDLIAGRIAQLFAPRGGLVYVPADRYPAAELPWWQSWEDRGLRITAVPVLHVGGRYGLDRNWPSQAQAFTGYIIEYHGMTVFFAGDTAYDRARFLAIRARFPSIDVALIPIAPLEPRAFMAHTHVDPDQALQAFADVGARRMVPIHFDTFINSEDHVGDAPRRLLAAMRERGLGDDRVSLLAVGEQRVFISNDPSRSIVGHAQAGTR